MSSEFIPILIAELSILIFPSAVAKFHTVRKVRTGFK